MELASTLDSIVVAMQNNWIFCFIDLLRYVFYHNFLLWPMRDYLTSQNKTSVAESWMVYLIELISMLQIGYLISIIYTG